jgi:hypothetical protein
LLNSICFVVATSSWGEGGDPRMLSMYGLTPLRQ